MAPVTRALLGGGIGSGKSTAAALFAAFGAEVFSADAAGHAVLEPGGAAAAAVARRWPQVLVEGRVDRVALAGIVFADRDARRELEAITHPEIARLLSARLAGVPGGVVLVEMPLPVDLLGPGWPWIVVDAPDEVRFARLLGRGLSPEDARGRMAAQPSREAWLQRADWVVDNSEDLAHLQGECRRAWEGLLGWGASGGSTLAG